ncbi:Ig-like domain-containing protein [Curtobacterium sp. RRHDQ10]|uniref:Ig-like domain-containing protein n=1 Tax=Curtobacterium phyllosphaerae TaxID=3413379 RepID=UPI003BF3B7C5
MFREFVRGHRSAVLTGAVAVLVGAVVATTAVVSSGYHTQRVDLGDGTVWVPSAEYGAVGRVNTGVLQLNTAIAAATDTLSVVQHGGTVYSVDETKATITRVDTADATLGDPVTLPSGSPQVFFAGSTAVIGNGDTGELWSAGTADLGQFDASSKPELTLGADAVFDADDSTVAVYSPRTGTASLVDVGSSLSVSGSTTMTMPRRHDFQVAAVGSHVAVLDRTDDVLHVDGRSIALGDRVSGRAALQRSSESGSSVVVASAAGLLRVSPSGAVTAESLPVSGNAARPFVDGACTYAAWAGGQAIDTCDGRAVQRLSNVPGGAELAVQHNGSTVVANDPDSGRTWAIDRSGQLIDNWDDLIQRDDRQQQQEQTSDDDAQVDTEQKPPVAVDDSLGARPGRTTVLPVLLNDYDPNGDPIVIDSTTGIDKSIGSVAMIDDQQELQIALNAEATGSVSFDYTISDGNGGTASAKVTVSIKQPNENSAPVQVRNTNAVSVQNGHVSTNVLSDWVDPDGDPVYLVSATAPDGDAVSTTPDGVVDFQDKSGETGKRTVGLVVSDGRDQGRGTLDVTVSGQGKVPLVADAFAVPAYAGKPLTVSPLDHVRGGNGTVTLTSVPSIARAVVTPSYDAGTFVFTSDALGDHQLEYTVTDGTKTATGIVRVTVLAPPDASTAPVTTPKTVFVHTLSTKDTDVTATDRDPAGGVLLVTGVNGIPPRSGVEATVLDQHTVRVTLTAPLAGAVSFTYDETNGLASAVGSVTVIEIPQPDHIQPPVAQPDSATVRVGDVTSIDVLANDSQPDGEPLTLEPDLVQNVPGGAGLLFVSGDELRYLAPQTPGNYTAVYRVDGPDGQHADAVVSIAVRERDAATNAPPVPQTITARVIAGQSVRVTVPVSGIDPDGDSVQLVGVASNPDKGSVSSVTGNSLVYEAGNYSAGTDEFTYTIVDALGARATGTIRVGIAPRANQASNPVAEPDHVTIRPGGTVTVRVLENDSDPDGGELTVTRVQPNGSGVRATIVHGQEVRITPPPTARSGDFAVLYTVQNATGGMSTAFATVTVDTDAQPLRPEVSDSILDLVDILHRRTVNVDVLKNVFFAEGSTSELQVGLVDGYTQNAKVTPSGRIQVTIADAGQTIPFSVARKDHPEIVSYAFVQVPGFADALPQLNRTAPALSVKSESSIQIPLSRYVVTANGSTARITDPSTVKATHASGGDLVVDSSTLTFTSAKLYFGNASISFEVTDGSSANGGKGRTATLVLPIRVLPRANQPPQFTGTSVEMQPGDTRTFDLTKLTNYPYPRDTGELTYSVLSRPDDGTTATVSGQQLTVRVADSTPKGSTAGVGIGVADDANQGQAGTVSIAVVGSTRPLVQPAADLAVTKRGSTTTIDVLANDAATNPFPGEPLQVVAIRGLDGGIPAGLSVTPSSDRSRLTVSVSSSAQPADTHLQYQVADATGDPDRRVWGDVTISVQDVPDQPSAPSRTGSYTGGTVALTWTAPASNNSPISRYVVTGRPSNGGTYTHDCGASTVCTLADLDPRQRYTFTVVAVNAIGSSDPSASSSLMSADYIPGAPTSVTATAGKDTPNRIVAAWNAVPTPSPGSAISGYVVTLNGPTGTQTQNVGPSTTSVAFDGLQPGGQYTATVYATNSALVVSDADWNRTTSSPAAAVGTPATPTITVTGTANGAGQTSVSARAAESDWAGGPATTFTIARFDPNTTVPSGCSTAGSSKTFTGATVTDTVGGDGDYQYVAYADNGIFCTASTPQNVRSYTPPGTPTAEASIENVGGSTGTWRSDDSGDFDVVVQAFAATGSVDHYVVTLSDGSSLQTTGGKVVITPARYGAPLAVTVTACRTSTADYCTTNDAVGAVRPVTARIGSLSGASGTIAFADPVNSPSGTNTYAITVCSGPLGLQCSAKHDDGTTAWQKGDTLPTDWTSISVDTSVTIGDSNYVDSDTQTVKQ